MNTFQDAEYYRCQVNIDWDELENLNTFQYLVAPPGSEQSSDANRQVVPIQLCADSSHPSLSFGSPAIGQARGSFLPVDGGYP